MWVAALCCPACLPAARTLCGSGPTRLCIPECLLTLAALPCLPVLLLPVLPLALRSPASLPFQAPSLTHSLIFRHSLSFTGPSLPPLPLLLCPLQLLGYSTPPRPLADEEPGLGADYDQEYFDGWVLRVVGGSVGVDCVTRVVNVGGCSQGELTGWACCWWQSIPNLSFEPATGAAKSGWIVWLCDNALHRAPHIPASTQFPWHHSESPACPPDSSPPS